KNILPTENKKNKTKCHVGSFFLDSIMENHLPSKPKLQQSPGREKASFWFVLSVTSASMLLATPTFPNDNIVSAKLNKIINYSIYHSEDHTTLEIKWPMLVIC